jgi:hypothetical protein
VPSGRRSIPKLLPARRPKRDGRPPDARLVLEALLNSVAVPLTVWNERAVVSYANDAARWLLGGVAAPPTTAEEWMLKLEPRTLSGLPFPIEDLPVMRALQGESPSLVDMRVRAAKGVLRLEASAKPIRDAAGQPRGALLWCPATRAPDG